VLIGGQAGQTIAAVDQFLDGKVQEGILCYRCRAPVHPQRTSTSSRRETESVPKVPGAAKFHSFNLGF
jgi:hypothetical protein